MKSKAKPILIPPELAARCDGSDQAERMDTTFTQGYYVVTANTSRALNAALSGDEGHESERRQVKESSGMVIARKMSTQKAIKDRSAGAFFQFAREYNEAADELADLHLVRTFDHPVHFLYFHTVELALKAFLRSFNVPIVGTKNQTHNLTKLYKQACSLGLNLGTSDPAGIGTIVALLESANEFHRLRYGNRSSFSVASISWIRSVVKQLMSAVEPYVLAHAAQSPNPNAGVPVQIIVTHEEPKPIQKQPEQG